MSWAKSSQLKKGESCHYSLDGTILDELRSFVNNAHGGLNTVYADNCGVPPVLSTVYKNGIEYDIGSNDYKKNKLALAVNPKLASSHLESFADFSDYCVGDWKAPELDYYALLHEKGSSAYLVLDRYPTKRQSFVALAQADDLWDNHKQRRKLVHAAYTGASIYNCSTKRSSVNHPSMSY